MEFFKQVAPASMVQLWNESVYCHALTCLISYFLHTHTHFTHSCIFSMRLILVKVTVDQESVTRMLGMRQEKLRQFRLTNVLLYLLASSETPLHRRESPEW